jgi:hypothetical protein
MEKVGEEKNEQRTSLYTESFVKWTHVQLSPIYSPDSFLTSCHANYGLDLYTMHHHSEMICSLPVHPYPSSLASGFLPLLCLE